MAIPDRQHSLTVAVVENDYEYTLPLSGRFLYEISISKISVKLRFSLPNFEMELSLADNATLVLPDGQQFELYAHEALSELIRLLEQEVSSASITKKGFLSIAFSSQHIIQNPPDESYESWTLHFSHPGDPHQPRGLFVCTAGGDVAIFGEPFEK